MFRLWRSEPVYTAFGEKLVELIVNQPASIRVQSFDRFGLPGGCTILIDSGRVTSVFGETSFTHLLSRDDKKRIGQLLTEYQDKYNEIAAIRDMERLLGVKVTSFDQEMIQFAWAVLHGDRVGARACFDRAAELVNRGEF